LPLFLKASVIANLISGASDNAYSCADSGFLYVISSNEFPTTLLGFDLIDLGTESSDLPSSYELY